MEADDFFDKLGTIKGLCEIALDLKRTYRVTMASDDINIFMAYVSITNPEYFRAIQELSGAGLQEELLQVHTICRWADVGMPVFDVTHSLMAALLLTDPSDVDASEVKLPFGTFAIQLPHGFWQMRGMSHEFSNVTYVLIHTYIAASRTSRNPQPMFAIRLISRKGNTSTWEIRQPLPESGRIGDWIDDNVPEVDDPTYGVIAPDSHDKALTTATRRLLINLCLYVAVNGRGERARRPNDNKKKQKKHEIPIISPDVWVVGREVKLDSELITSAKAWSDSRGSNREPWRLRSRFTVRGHWRQQAHGPGRAERKLMWIAPFWKGEGPKFSHLYTSTEN